jgi:hypothetical protein
MTSKKENSENTSAYKKRKLINKVANNSKNTDISSMNLKDKQNYFKSQSRTLGGNVSEPFISPLLMNEERKKIIIMKVLLKIVFQIHLILIPKTITMKYQKVQKIIMVKV